MFVLSFSVTDSDFNAQRVSDKCVKFIKYANKLNSFYKYFHIAGAFEGGFSFETHHILDPLTRLAKYSNSYLSSRYDLRGSKHFIRPKAGMLLIWPHDIVHSVEPFYGMTERAVINFNIQA